ncbi:helix-turn-helix transcriptional regulator [Terasakiella sp. A23]|uniref:helix-turn-helix transcriptional regulator n=1 Tax=Terasakiella sp. FCG-A23 TaxID=3080561 RepID=UPI002952D567|nr:helix-turn-helix transcriptional regulator [Terasakiella sp. A23]MDV7340921.1 helix-turn-helix transcriptional regulator [Terasakiella sp. A23]
MSNNQKHNNEVKALIFSFIVIAMCEVFFLIDVVADLFGVDVDTSWIAHDEIELTAAIILSIALVVIGNQILRLLKKHRQIQASVEVASGELLKVINRHFTDWKFSPSEQEVALLLIKGMSTQEIADLRNTKTGTVKSQSSSIYQKAEVRGRNELVAFFVEDLLAGEKILKEEVNG